MFCIAGAGSGKTRVLVNRVGHLINHHHIEPHRILAITFTKKSSNEMKDRLETIIGPVNIETLNIGTMHSIFLRILKAEVDKHMPKWKGFELMTKSYEKKKYTEQAMNACKCPPEFYDLSECMRQIGLIKNLEDNYILDCEDWVQRVYKEYEDILEKKKLLEFDSILSLTKILLERNPAIAARYGRRYKYILVDEYQDTNPVQSAIIKMLVDNNGGNIFAVGDIEQSIYGFRGSKPGIMLNYKEMYPDAELVKLDINYRSGINIVNKANQLISMNKSDLTLDLVTDISGGDIHKLQSGDSADHEAANIRSEIESIVADKEFEYRDISILYRTNQQSRALEDEMVRNQIPYQIIGSEGFYHRAEIKDMLAYLWIVQNPHRCSNAIERIFNRPNRFLGRAWLDKYLEKIHDNDELEALRGDYGNAGMTRNSLKLWHDIQSLIKLKEQNYSPGQLIEHIRQVIKYDHWLLQQCQEAEDSARLGTLNEFTNSAGRFETVEKLFTFIKMLKMKNQADNDRADKVSLLTVHKAKGLEWPVVFISGMTEGILPHYKAQVNEERRVMYVALTRAMKKLYLSHFFMPNEDSKPSRFYKEIGL